ncbi:methyltransferase, FxLD system [Kitasatospora aburaviensis]
MGALRRGPLSTSLSASPSLRAGGGLADAYHHDLALITRRDELSRATSSVSAVWLQADMLENARLRPGAAVLEVGSGGYNAALIAHVVGPTGRVVTVDLDPFVVERTRRFTAETGIRNIVAVRGDGALGAPAAAVPRGGFDAIIVTYNAWDIAPAWREQLAEGGHLVVPLEVHGYTRAITLKRRGEELVARGWTYCGFIRDAGALGRTTPEAMLADGELRLRFEDGPGGDTAGLDGALRGARHEVLTGVTVARGESFETLQLYLATVLHQQGFCRLAKDRKVDTGIADIPPGADAAALLGKASLAYLTYTPTAPGTAPDGTVEFAVHSYGQAGSALAERLAGAVRVWDDQARAHGYPELTIHPAGTPDTALPDGHRIDKPGSCLAFHWHPPAPAPGPAASTPGTSHRGSRRDVHGWCRPAGRGRLPESCPQYGIRVVDSIRSTRGRTWGGTGGSTRAIPTRSSGSWCQGGGWRHCGRQAR